jgi:translation initiation factor 3 subunit D
LRRPNTAAVLLYTYLQNNLAKIAKWTMCALLAGADMIKLGYVSRAGEPGV